MTPISNSFQKIDHPEQNINRLMLELTDIKPNGSNRYLQTFHSKPKNRTSSYHLTELSTKLIPQWQIQVIMDTRNLKKKTFYTSVHLVLKLNSTKSKNNRKITNS